MSLKERTRQCNDIKCKGESIGMAKCVVPQCVATRDRISTSTGAASSNGVSTTTSPTVASSLDGISSTTSPTDTESGKDKITDHKSGVDLIPGSPKKGMVQMCDYKSCLLFR